MTTSKALRLYNRSKTLDYKKALAWTTFTTAFGCGLAMFLAGELVIVFKGKGLVPDDVILMQNFPLAVGAGAAITVMLATFLNLPVSTTHALIVMIKKIRVWLIP